MTEAVVPVFSDAPGGRAAGLVLVCEALEGPLNA